jgi:ribosomal protein S18 acetylase RimI-like enzyme
MTTNTITTFELKAGTAPEIDGLQFRGFMGESDYQNMIDVFQACIEADQIEEEHTLEDLIRYYNNIQRCNLYTEMIFAEIHDKVVGYGRCWWNHELNNDYVYISFVNLIPEWRGTDIGLAMGRHLHARIHEIARRHPDDAPKYLQMNGPDSQQWHTGLIEDLDLKAVRYSIQMTRPCSLPIEITPLPEGLEERPTKTTEIRKIWESANEAFRDHFGFVEPTEEEYENWIMEPDFQPQLWKIAWDGDQAAGNVLNFVRYNENDKFNRKRGYTEGISVRRPWRRKGVARALLTQSIKMFQDMGMEETCLFVDTKNPSGALKLYTSVGYKEIKRYVTYRKQFN